ncbi:hypothetical protein ATKI12_2123 [Kitasatospora sp. Ki12]
MPGVPGRLVHPCTIAVRPCAPAGGGGWRSGDRAAVPRPPARGCGPP